MANEQNLKPFKPGNPGGGRPKGSISLVKVLEKVVNQKLEVNDPFTKQLCKKSVKELVVLALLNRAMKGEVKAIKEVFERIDGKVVQKIQGELTRANKADDLSDDELAAIIAGEKELSDE